MHESDEAKEAIRSEFKKRLSQNFNVPINEERPATVMDILLETDEGDTNPESDEISRYLSEPQINRNLDPQVWWKAHENCFPSVAKLAKQILGTPATSVDSERDFSCAENIVSSSRTRLLPENVNLLVFLHQNKTILFK